MVSAAYKRKRQTLGVIGGSGLSQMAGLQIVGARTLATPYGAPSAPLVEAHLGDARVLFLPRHGAKHRIPPHEINHRANICALKMAGAQQVLSISAVGSMKEEIAPGDVVIVDQFLDFTKQRVSTYFEAGLVAHVAFADPVCGNLAQAARDAAGAAGARVHFGGTYVCIEGPQFSTRAESLLYRSLGASVVGMTAVPEAKLAREALLPYATVALVTDYDSWHKTAQPVTVDAVLKVLKRNVSLAHQVVENLVQRLPDPSASVASRALQNAVITHADDADPEVRARLTWLLE